MDDRRSPTGSTILVIGYGNTLRSDDGVGPRVAMAMASRALPGLTAIAVQQLTPELAQPLAAAELAIFVDARRADGDKAVAVQPLEPAGWEPGNGHTSDPRALLALAHAVFGRAPRSWLVTVPAIEFSLGEGLSVTAGRAAEDALERITAFTEHRRGDL
jgi:hydrogenase maturation protease